MIMKASLKGRDELECSRLTPTVREEKPREERKEAQDDTRKRNSLMRAPNMRHGRLHIVQNWNLQDGSELIIQPLATAEGQIRGGGKRMGQERLQDEARESLWRDQRGSR